MTSLTQGSIQISMESSESFEEGYFLPDRFLDTRISEKLWLKLLPPGRRLKDYAQVVVDFAGAPKKAAKMMPMHVILSRMLGHAKLREVIYSKLDHSKPLHSDLLIEKNLSRYWKKLSDTFGNVEPVVFNSEIKALMPDYLYEQDARVLSLLANKEAYDTLDYDQKDLADLVVNLVLIRIGSDELICKFLNEFTFIGERQTKLLEHANKKLQEGDSAHKSNAIAKNWKKFALKVLGDIEEDLNISVLSSLGIAINEFFSDPVTSPSTAFKLLLEEDIEHFKKVTGKLIQKCEKALAACGEQSPPEWLVSIKQILNNQLVVPEINNFSVAHCKVTEKYIESREKIFSDEESDFLTIDKQLIASYELRKKIADIIGGNDISKMATVGDLGASLSEAVAIVNQTTEAMISCFSKHDELLKQYLASLVELGSDSASVESAVVNAATVGVSESNGLASEVRKLKADTNRLSKQLKKITNLQETQLKRLTQTLIAKEEAEEKLADSENETRTLKEQLHAVRQQISYIPSSKGVTSDTQLVDLLRSHLKNERADVESLLEAYASLAPDRLIILPSAFKSARESSNFELLSRLAVIIDAITFPYLDSVLSGIPDSEARNIIGSRYAAKESDTVFQNSKLKAMREFEYNGQTFYFEQHVGIGSGYGTQHAIRLHFKILDDKVVIAYCGKHLETARTN